VLKQELATWLGNDKNISVVPFGVDRAFYGESTVARERAGASGAFRKTRSSSCTSAARSIAKTCRS